MLGLGPRRSGESLDEAAWEMELTKNRELGRAKKIAPEVAKVKITPNDIIKGESGQDRRSHRLL